MNLEPIRRHSALAVQRVEEPQSNDLDDGVARHRAKRPSSLFEHTLETLVAERAARIRNLSHQHRSIDLEIANDDVDVGVVSCGSAVTNRARSTKVLNSTPGTLLL